VESTKISGIRIAYELLGEVGAPAIAITPGGRFSTESPGVRAFGEALAAGGRRVLLWDRPNCGASDLSFAGEGEGGLHASVLMQLILKLELGPTALVGGSAGGRVSLLAALEVPEMTSHVVSWWISGGIVSLMSLGTFYCCDTAVAARSGGMEAVAAMPLWKEQLSRNPRNRDILLSQDPELFVATMERWASGYVASEASPVPGLTPDGLAQLKMPVMIFRGDPADIWHPERITAWVHQQIPNSLYADPPWQGDIFAQRMAEGKGLFVDWPLLAPAILAFTGG
jgi:2-hydroxy-6-oxonona-2,4-dienedioate hydrolase